MKKSIILMIVIIIAMINKSSAQDNPTDFRDMLMFGMKVGTNYSNVYDTKGEAFQANGKFGFAAGAFIVIPIGKFLGLQPEVLLSQKGFSATGGILGSTHYEFTRTTTYLDVPLFVSLKPSEFFTIMAGPQFSYLLKQKDVFANGTTSTLQ